MQVCLLWGLLQKLSIVLFCRVDAFKETYQLVTNIFDYCDFIWFVISEL